MNRTLPPADPPPWLGAVILMVFAFCAGVLVTGIFLTPLLMRFCP